MPKKHRKNDFGNSNDCGNQPFGNRETLVRGGRACIASPSLMSNVFGRVLCSWVQEETDGDKGQDMIGLSSMWGYNSGFTRDVVMTSGDIAAVAHEKVEPRVETHTCNYAVK